MGRQKINKINEQKAQEEFEHTERQDVKCGHEVEIFDEHAKEILTEMMPLDSRPEENGK